MTRGQRIAVLTFVTVLLAGAGGYRYLHTMPVGTGETRASPDGRFTASVMDWSARGFFTNTYHRWFEYRVDGPGVRHELVGNPIVGPYFGSRSSHRVIRWSDNGSYVEFVFPDTILRLTVGAAGPCRLAADLTGFKVQQTANGFLVRPQGWQDMRRMQEMFFSFLPGGETLLGLDRQVRVGADVVRYDLFRESGGSGGDEITMRAERPLKTGTLRLEWRGQAEAGIELDLTEAWALMASVDCEA